MRRHVLAWCPARRGGPACVTLCGACHSNGMLMAACAAWHSVVCVLPSPSQAVRGAGAGSHGAVLCCAAAGGGGHPQRSQGVQEAVRGGSGGGAPPQERGAEVGLGQGGSPGGGGPVRACHVARSVSCGCVWCGWGDCRVCHQLARYWFGHVQELWHEVHMVLYYWWLFLGGFTDPIAKLWWISSEPTPTWIGHTPSSGA